jgi:5'-nucleotidase
LIKRILSIGIIIAALTGIPRLLLSEEITLIFSNDIHGTYKPSLFKSDTGERLVGGMEAASHYLNLIRKIDKNTLLIDGGDLLTGTLVADLNYKSIIGGAMVEFLNRLEYDVWCLGNHDFDKGSHNALGLINLGKFPSLMANVVQKKNGKLIIPQPYAIFNRGGIRIGIIAVMEENFLEEVYKKNVEDLEVLPIVPTLNAYIPVVEKQADLVVVVVHSKFHDGARIAKSVSGIDVVLVASESGRFEEINEVLVASTFGHQKTLGYLKLEISNGEVKNHDSKMIWLWADVELHPSPGVSAFIKEVDELIGTDFRTIIGEAQHDMELIRYPKHVIPIENELGNWITDVMRWKTGADIGFQNTGGIRANIPAGPISKGAVFNVCPFGNTVVTFALTGKELKRILELDIERGEDRLQISGFSYKYFARGSKPSGKRVSFIEVNGEVIVKDGEVLLPERTFSVASNDYLAGHAEDKYFGFPVDKVSDTGAVLSNVLMEWLEIHKVLDYKREERITQIK